MSKKDTINKVLGTSALYSTLVVVILYTMDIPQRVLAYDNTVHFLDGGTLKCGDENVNSELGYKLSSFDGDVNYMKDQGTSVSTDGKYTIRVEAGNDIDTCEIVK